MFVAPPKMLRSLNFLGQAGDARDLARRARRLANTSADPADRSRLLRYAEELDDQANRLELAAHSSGRQVIAPRPVSD